MGGVTVEYQHWTIREAMQRIVEKRLYLPAIQRKFVWKAEQIEKLFDSIMRDYPIGTFLFWMVQKAKHNDYSYYEFIREFHERDNWKNSLAAKPHLPDELVGVLDGQQRLNSMYVALQGTYAYRRPRMWWNNPHAFPVRRFYINVFKEEVEREDDDVIYEFRFLTPEEAEVVNAEQCWCLVKDLLDCKDVPAANRYWSKKRRAAEQKIEVTDKIDDRALNIIVKLWERLTTIPVINFFPVVNQELDEVLDIFVRVNSAGTPLAKTDLLFSTIVAHWEDGRDAIENFLQETNRKGNGFWFDTDFIMRACLVLADCPVRLRVASFKSANVKLIVKDWNAITRAIDCAVDLLTEWGFDGETLTSVNAIIPLAYAIKIGCALPASKPGLRLLLVKSLLLGVYGSSGDQVLSSMRKGMEETLEPGDTFDCAKFDKKVRLPGGRSLVFDEAALDELVLSTKGARTFALLSLLSPNLKFSQVQFHQDHMHPYAAFSNSKLQKMKFAPEKIADWQEKRDMLPNLRLLEGRENQSKSDASLSTWLEKQYPDAADRTLYLRSNYVPVVSVDFAEFEAFFDGRKAALKTALAKLLDVRLQEAR